MDLPFGATDKCRIPTTFPFRLEVISTELEFSNFTETIVCPGSSSNGYSFSSNFASNLSPRGVSALNPSGVHLYMILAPFLDLFILYGCLVLAWTAVTSEVATVVSRVRQEYDARLTRFARKIEFPH